MKVAILMGSPRDADKMKGASDMLDRFGVEHEVHVMSAHRTPADVAAFTEAARDNGWIKQHGIAVVEESAQSRFEAPEGYEELDRRVYGDTEVIFLRAG